MTPTEQKLYKHFNCQPSTLGWGGDPQSDGKRAKIDRTHRYFLKHEFRVSSCGQMTRIVRDEWTAGLGPVASWLMWQAIKAIVIPVIKWLWNYYHSAEGIAERHET